MLAVISGATKGIGKEIAKTMVSEGFDIAMGARNKGELEGLCKELEKMNPQCNIFFMPVDFSEKEQLKEFVNEILSRWKKIDLIVNNVGAFIPGTVLTEPEDIFELHLKTNLHSAWYLTRPFLEGMKLNKKGHIFNICSVASLEPRHEAASYSISKAAMYAFNKVLCEEMRNYNVKVTAIFPGSVNTASWDGVNAPLYKFVQPKDVASAVMNAYKMSEHAFIEEIIIKPLDKRY
jgi:3-oxoacyl-[acyl-carrier protein] reductase